VGNGVGVSLGMASVGMEVAEGAGVSVGSAGVVVAAGEEQEVMSKRKRKEERTIRVVVGWCMSVILTDMPVQNLLPAINEQTSRQVPAQDPVDCDLLRLFQQEPGIIQFHHALGLVDQLIKAAPATQDPVGRDIPGGDGRWLVVQ